MTAQSRADAEQRLRVYFRIWLGELNDTELAALNENWDNVMNDAALDRIGSWVIAERALTTENADRQQRYGKRRIQPDQTGES